MAAASDDDLRAVDTFLAGAKRLEGGLPEWVASERPDDVTANWNIVDDLDIVRGSLRFRLSRLAVDFPSVSLIFRQNCVWRVDLVPPGNLKRNPPWASEFGLPASFRGSHCHAWADNRAYIGRAGWVGLPAHRPVEPALRRVRQMLLHIPTKPAGYPEVMSATHSNLIAATVPISSRPGDAVSSGRFW